LPAGNAPATNRAEAGLARQAGNGHVVCGLGPHTASAGRGAPGDDQPAVYAGFYGDGSGLPFVFAARLWLDSRAKWVYLYLCRRGDRYHARWTGWTIGQTPGGTEAHDSRAGAAGV